MSTVKIYSDGGSRGNPGLSACAFVVYLGETEYFAQGYNLGIETNNVAEYQGLRKALTWLSSSSLQPQAVGCHLDSLLVVNQVKGLFKIKQTHLQSQARDVHEIISKLTAKGWSISFSHVPREKNKRADELVNQMLDTCS